MTVVWEPRGRISHTSIGQIALSPNFASDQLVVAISPAGLHISKDGGAHWVATARGIVGPFIRDVAIDNNGTILATSPAGLFISPDLGIHWNRSLTPEPFGAITMDGDDAFLVASETDGSVWRGALTTGLLRSWATLPEPATQLIAVGNRVFALVGRSIFSTRDGVTWQRDTLSCMGEIESFSISLDGSVSVASSDRGVMLSTNGGETWVERQVRQSVLSVAITPDGSRLFVGVVGDGVLRSEDLGCTWRQSDMNDGAIIVGLTDEPDGLCANLIEGVTLQSRDLQAWCDVQPWFHFQEATIREGRDALHLADDDEIVDRVVAEDGSIAVAIKGSDGGCSVHLRSCEGNWRKIIAHPETARTVHLVMNTGPRDLFAAIGDSVYRPAKLGVALFTREVIDVENRSEVLALSGMIDGHGEPILAALTISTISISTDRGINWITVPRPDGPPVTAIAWRFHQSVPELVAAQLGGTLYALPYETLRSRFDDKGDKPRP